MIKKTIRIIIGWIGGNGFSLNDFSIKQLLKQLFIQKLLRINAHVPWPVHWSSTIVAVENIEKGTRCPGLSMACHIDGRNGIVIEENVWIGPRVSIISMNHDVNSFKNYIKEKPIIIKKNCWLATNSIILAGVELGEHTIVAAGAVVTKSFPNRNQILAGNPARIIKEIDEYLGE